MKFSCRKLKRRYRTFMEKLFSFVNLFYEPYLYRKLCKEIALLPEGTQPILVNRTDFGPSLITLRYGMDWNQQLGPIALVVLSRWQEAIVEMAEVLLPNAKIIAPHSIWRKIFGGIPVHLTCYANVQAKLCWTFPYMRFIWYDGRERGLVKSELLLELSSYGHSSEFMNLAKKCACNADICQDSRDHSIELLQAASLKQQRLANREIEEVLGLDSKYVLLNLPQTPFPQLYFNRIGEPERYNVLIDHLISMGYQVVLHGRTEQFPFNARAGLINYAYSDHCSPTHDLQLFSGAEFAIVSATGSENFSTLFMLPTLCLDRIGQYAQSFNPKNRFYPKKIFSKKQERYLTITEILSDPVFFQLNGRLSDNPYLYHEMEERELLSALLEFMQLVDSDDWETLTDNQKAFRKLLTPLHADLFAAKTVPCDCYLEAEMSKTNSPLVVESEVSTSSAVPL